MSERELDLLAIKLNAGGGGGSEIDVHVENKKLIFRAGGTVDGTKLIIGGNDERN